MIVTGDWRYLGRKSTYALFSADYWPIVGVHPRINVHTRAGAWTDHLEPNFCMCWHKGLAK